MFDPHELDTFSTIYERDVDLALVLAIRSSEAVRQRIAEAAGAPTAELLSVRHSVGTENGREADLVVRLGTSDSPFEIQIEDKLDASFQPEQGPSYAARVRAAIATGEVSGACALLVAPQAYLSENKAGAEGVDGSLSYESLRDVLAEEGAWGQSVALLLEHALLQHRRGGRPSPDDPARTKFFAGFAAAGEARGLPPIPRKGRKAQAGHLWYPRAGTLTPLEGWTIENASHGTWLAAKFEEGRADIELTGAGPLIDLPALTRALQDQDVEVFVNSKSVQLRTDAPRLSPDEPVEIQAEAIETFIDRLIELKEWWGAQGRRIVEASLRSDVIP